tara:strand:- start:19032 stop:19463 length:432 start_codon:yes stop_codon:yes gene_type:complete
MTTAPHDTEPLVEVHHPDGTVSFSRPGNQCMDGKFQAAVIPCGQIDVASQPEPVNALPNWLIPYICNGDELIPVLDGRLCSDFGDSLTPHFTTTVSVDPDIVTPSPVPLSGAGEMLASAIIAAILVKFSMDTFKEPESRRGNR